MKLRRNPLADLQARADLRAGDVEIIEQAVVNAVTHYRRQPSPRNHQGISRAVKCLLEAQGGRP